MSKEYPVEIYPKPNERIKDSAERIYDRGYADGLKAHIDKLTRRVEIYEERLGRVARNHPEAYAQALAGDAQ